MLESFCYTRGYRCGHTEILSGSFTFLIDIGDHFSGKSAGCIILWSPVVRNNRRGFARCISSKTQRVVSGIRNRIKVIGVSNAISNARIIRISIYRIPLSVARAFMPTGYDFLKKSFQRDGDIPIRVVVTHFTKIAIIANVVTDTVFIYIGVDL